MTNRELRAWRAKAVLRQGGKCFYCLRLMNSGEPGAVASLDHLVPISRGGLDVASNFVAACERCNFQKGNISVQKFIGRQD